MKEEQSNLDITLDRLSREPQTAPSMSRWLLYTGLNTEEIAQMVWIFLAFMARISLSESHWYHHCMMGRY